MADPSEAILSVLNNFINEHKTITTAAVISLEGMPVSTVGVSENVHIDTLAIMTATMFGAAATVNSELKCEMPEMLHSSSKDKDVLVVPLGTKGLLLVITNTHISGALMIAMTQTAEKLKSVM